MQHSYADHASIFDCLQLYISQPEFCNALSLVTIYAAEIVLVASKAVSISILSVILYFILTSRYSALLPLLFLHKIIHLADYKYVK